MKINFQTFDWAAALIADKADILADINRLMLQQWGLNTDYKPIERKQTPEDAL